MGSRCLGAAYPRPAWGFPGGFSSAVGFMNFGGEILGDQSASDISAVTLGNLQVWVVMGSYSCGHLRFFFCPLPPSIISGSGLLEQRNRLSSAFQQL